MSAEIIAFPNPYTRREMTREEVRAEIRGILRTISAEEAATTVNRSPAIDVVQVPTPRRMNADVLPFRMKQGPMTEAECTAARVRKRFADQFQRRAPDELVQVLVAAVMAAPQTPKKQDPRGIIEARDEWQQLVAAIKGRVAAKEQL